MTKTQQQRRQQWQQWIAGYRASGLSAREWCASHGVNPHRLWYWLRRFRTEEESGSTKWLPVDLSGVETKGQAEGLVPRWRPASNCPRDSWDTKSLKPRRSTRKRRRHACDGRTAKLRRLLKSNPVSTGAREMSTRRSP